ncbi:DNA repair protein RecN [Caldicellulosiruptoraceae bacterium PP1]
MFKRLYIENIAIIEKLEIEFEEGLTIFTGETGAGKSIIIDSMLLLMGMKANKEIIRTGANKASVSAIIEIENNSQLEKIVKYGINVDEKTLYIHREISLNGKNICRINNSYVSLQLLRDIMKDFIEIHGQFENKLLNEKKEQLKLLDRYCYQQLEPLLGEYTFLYNEYVTKQKELNELLLNETEKERKLDLINYQINEIDYVDPKIGEDIILEQKKDMIINATKIKSNIHKVINELDKGEGYNRSIIEKINLCLRYISDLTKFSNNFSNYYDRLNNILADLEDIRDLIYKDIDKLDVDENDINYIIERLDKINKIKKKYGNSIEDILNYKNSLLKERDSIEGSNSKINLLKTEIINLKTQLEDLAIQISKIRKESATIFINKVIENLKQLEMPDSKFDIKFEKKELSINGVDDIEFLISANVGQELKPLSKIASGGELSRIILSIKAIIAEKDDICLMVFDEIDSGISGVTGLKLSLLLKGISKNRQVLSVTHLPQVAAAADNHFYVYKEVVDNNTFSKVKKLTDNESVYEIARMYAGNNISEYSIKQAIELKKFYMNNKN